MTFAEIKKETQFLLGLENDTNFAIYTKEQITRHSNRALDELTSFILRTDGRWQWDDVNHADLPIAVTDIVSEQSQYTIDTKHLTVDRLELKDANGKWYKLKTIDESDIDIALEEYDKVAGTPTHYDKQGESLILYPKPNFTQVDSLKIYYSRPASYFTIDDDSKEPGFAEIFHNWIPLWNAFNYASSNVELGQIAQNMKVRLDEMKETIKKYYSTRRKRSRLTVAKTNRF